MAYHKRRLNQVKLHNLTNVLKIFNVK